MNKHNLYIIATPIGNMEDITLRALRLLKEDVSAVFCEDTRQSKKILNHYGIDIPAYSLHAHSAESSINFALSLLEQGKTLAYITDCGTPCISDPGSRLVAAVRDKGFSISPIPGASAVTALASVSGFSGKHLHFAGFLSKKEGRRRSELTALAAIQGTIIIYESPHRIKKTLASIADIFPGKKITIGREMTKMFEEFLCGTIGDPGFKIDSIKEKGEFAIAIDNSNPAEQIDDESDGEE